MAYISWYKWPSCFLERARTLTYTVKYKNNVRINKVSVILLKSKWAKTVGMGKVRFRDQTSIISQKGSP